MEAGRDLDELVARSVMNWPENWSGAAIPPYSQDITAAWTIFEQHTWILHRHMNVHGQIQYFIFEDERSRDAMLPLAFSPSAPLAICLAALQFIKDHH